MIDFYCLINSKDVGEYLRELKYDFSVKEAAYVVYRTHKLTLKEKIVTWNWILDNMEMQEKELDFCSDLRTYIEVQRKKLNIFWEEDENAYFKFELIDAYDIKSKRWSGTYVNDYIYKDYSSCIGGMNKERETMFASNYEFRGARIIKKWYEIENKRLYIEIDFKENIFKAEFDEYDEKTLLFKAEYKVDKLFENININIPYPFQKGDILGYYYWSDYSISSLLIIDFAKKIEEGWKCVLLSLVSCYCGIPYIYRWRHSDLLDYERRVETEEKSTYLFKKIKEFVEEIITKDEFMYNYNVFIKRIAKDKDTWWPNEVKWVFQATELIE